MDVEHTIKTIVVDANWQSSVNELVAEGWELVPGIPPVAIYHLARVKKPVEEPLPPGTGGALGILRINDDLISVVPSK